jgi:putative intracellular protease/amidase/YHS domain-containing protein
MGEHAMKRRDMIRNSTMLGLLGAMPLSRAIAAQASAAESAPQAKPVETANKLTPPASGAIPVAFLISDGAVIIDFCGPWEVFGAMVGGRMDAFRRYTVAATAAPITASGGMKIVPNFTIANAPAPKVIVIPAQDDPSEAVLEWIRKSSKSADLTMSVCTGAYVLAQTGLLSGKSATTHHSAYADLAMKYPDIHVKRGARFVEEGNLASAGGLSSGIDLALRVVERYYGRDAATQAAFNMEYQGQGWLDPNSNSIYAKVRMSADHPVCPVCSMDVNVASSPKSLYKGTTYYFCSVDHKGQFDAAPDSFVAFIERI